MLLKLAWRNIWRNRRRTLITVASILFAVLFASFMESLQKGAWNNMIGNVVNYYFGFVQVHQKGYWEEQSLDKSFTLTDSTVSFIQETPGVSAVIPRLESFALAASDESTSGAMVVGTNPDLENSMTQLKDRLTKGQYLKVDDQAVLLGEGLAEKLALNIGDTLVLISQGYHGANAAGKYPIKGFVKFGSPDLNKQMVVLPLEEAQQFYAAPDQITSLALKIDDQDAIKKIVRHLETKLDTAAYEVMDWEAMLPDLVEAKSLDSAGNIIVYFILYMIIAFGILGTILMMAKEREYEMGVLVSIGMKRRQLGWSIWMEVVLLAILGGLSGILAAIPVVWYFKVNPLRFSGEYAATLEKFDFEPIFPALFDWKILITQALIVLIITALLALYPFWKISKLKPVEAMRN
ncbi:MAG TPA: FtsX-like permease family protein [Saprospiraceae bacterium]|nr:FtsX-like permease family protein [Saprospiraceae bacterium]HMQ81894.1 FtsX-like permease family protein [Saprospiraceae bacterium]